MIDLSHISVNGTTPDMAAVLAVSAFSPEALVLCTALVLLMGGVYGATRRMDGLVAKLGSVMLLCLFAIMAFSPPLQHRLSYFSHMFVLERFGHFVKMMLVGSTALTFLLAGGWLNRKDNQRFEFPVLMLFALLGAMLMVSANDLLSLYVGLELSSLPLYVLASMSRDSLKSTEAGLKYFVLGALASGMLLFGASLVYGFAGTTNFDALAQVLKDSSGISGGVAIGLVLMLVAFCFKISAAPFHMWTPDVYEGAPTPVTAFFSLVPKMAALALLIRLLSHPFAALAFEWRQIVVFVSIASMLAGAFGALMQTNIKRLLAYSSIGHVGYALMGLAAGTSEGIGAVLVYFTLYIFMSAGAFASVLMMNVGGEAVENISDLAGLSRTRPRMAFALAVFMFSMAGIPPLAGFFGKLYVFLAALNAGLFGLAVTGVLASVVACYYYLKVVKIMYFDEPSVPFDKEVAPGARLVLTVCVLATFLFFIMPAPLVAEARLAAQTLFAGP